MPVQASRVVLDVQVGFELRDLRHQGRYDAADRTMIERHVLDRLVSAFGRRFPHVQFSSAPGQYRLQCVLNTGANIEAPAQTDTQADALSFHFRLTGTTLPAQPVHSWIYQEVDQYWDAIPERQTFLRMVDEFLDEGMATSGDSTTRAARRAAADGRFTSLFDAVLNQLPVFTDRDIVHVAGTRFLVIKTPREDFLCSLPDLSEFRLQVDLEDPLGPQHHEFRARLLNVSALNASQPPAVPAELCRGLVTEAVQPLRGSTNRHLEQLAQVPAKVDRTVYLLRPGPVDQACLETSPTDFQPNSGR